MKIKLNFFLFILFGYLNFIQINCSVTDNELNIIEESLSLKFYKNANFEIFNNKNNSTDEKCVQHLKFIQNGLSRREEWVLELIDSWGKIPSGILTGNFIDLGNYDECLKVISNEKIENNFIKGKYCQGNFPLNKLLPKSLVSLLTNYNKDEPKLPSEIFNKIKEHNRNTSVSYKMEIPKINLSIGMCVPKTCRPDYLNEVIKEFLKRQFKIELDKSDMILNSKSCRTHPDDLHFRAIDIVAVVIFGIIGALIIISSIYDLIIQQLNKTPYHLFISFSIITNGRKLFAPAPVNSDNVIECLNGIRCLSMLWILVGHAYAFSSMSPFINRIDMIQWKSSAFAQLIFNANIAVDSFFFLSGFLVAFIGFKELKKSNGKLNILLMYFHRYIRLTPVIAALILFTLSLMKYLGSGPYWDLLMNKNACEDNWWSTILYVLNYASPHNPCLLHTWYLSVDTQLYVLSPLLLLPTYKWGRKFLYPVACIVCILSIGCCFATHLIYEFSLIRPDEYSEGPDKYKSMIYYATHIRLPPWVVGFVLGYYMFQNKLKRFKISKSLILIAWILTITVILSIVFGTYKHYQPNSSIPTPLESNFYESFKRISWSFALSWIVFACQKGYGGFINSFLSYPFWAVFGRLTYCIYLNHIFVLMVHFGIMKSNFYFSNYEIQLAIWGHFGITILISVLTSLAFELPILEIEKAIFSKKDEITNHKRSNSHLGLENQIKNNIE